MAAGAGIVPMLAGAASAAPVAPDPAEPVTCAPIDFDKAAVTSIPSTATAGSNRLTVTGMMPATNYWVTLDPYVYIQQPDYWGIGVTACSSGIGAQVLTPFTVTYDFVGSMGTCGIEVVGATRTERFDLAGCAATNPLVGTKWTLDPRSLGAPLPAGRTITATFSDTTVTGSAGCNQYSATYRVTGAGTIDVGDNIITTRMACDRRTARAEATFLKKLAASDRFWTVSGGLRLSGPAGSLLFR